MSKQLMFDVESGNYVGEVEIPDGLLEAAARIETWMKSQPMPHAVRLHGLMLADDLNEEGRREMYNVRC